MLLNSFKSFKLLWSWSPTSLSKKDAYTLVYIYIYVHTYKYIYIYTYIHIDTLTIRLVVEALVKEPTVQNQNRNISAHRYFTFGPGFRIPDLWSWL